MGLTIGGRENSSPACNEGHHGFLQDFLFYQKGFGRVWRGAANVDEAGALGYQGLGGRDKSETCMLGDSIRCLFEGYSNEFDLLNNGFLCASGWSIFRILLRPRFSSSKRRTSTLAILNVWLIRKGKCCEE